MENNLQITEKSNKIMPIIIGILGALYGVSPVDAIPDVIPVAGWIDDLVISGGAFMHTAQAFMKDSNKSFATIIGILKWFLWIIGGILVMLVALLGVTIYGLLT